ncbi:MAG: sulfur carrier protein ThiS [Tannerella sp.]|jgi:sulfur carrier protein|nr:sulfur carrier protein ThiS [Tannerella sp.]
MVIKLNDKSYDVMEGMTLDRFIENLNIPVQGIAIAINYEVVPRNRWPETALEDGMALLMIHAVSGG